MGEKKHRQIKQALYKCTEELCNVFKDNPHYFWKEEDIQSYLYGLMMEMNEFYLKIENEKDIFLVHREYKTLGYVKKILEKTNNPKAGGEIDLVIWDPENWDKNDKLWAPDFRVLHGIEIKFPTDFNKNGLSTRFKENGAIKELEKDYFKLISPINGIKNRHILVFLKNEEFAYQTEENFLGFIKERSSIDLEKIDITFKEVLV